MATYLAARATCKAHSPGHLVAEFSRLAVHPDARYRGIRYLLMAERLRRVEDRIQIGLVETRMAHS